MNLIKAIQKIPWNVLQINAENKPAMKRNKTFLNDLSGDICTIEAITKLQIIVNTHWQQFKLLTMKSNQTK